MCSSDAMNVERTLIKMAVSSGHSEIAKKVMDRTAAGTVQRRVAHRRAGRIVQRRVAHRQEKTTTTPLIGAVRSSSSSCGLDQFKL
jgi:hypothetical protein